VQTLQLLGILSRSYSFLLALFFAEPVGLGAIGDGLVAFHSFCIALSCGLFRLFLLISRAAFFS
jgi:hypothetical protein